jgi:hypothetical protein
MDNFDLKKFLKESKALENLNPILKKENLNEGNMRGKIREMILAELGGEDYELEDRKQKYGINPEIESEEDEDYSDYFFDIDTPEEELEEAKKKKKDEEVEDVETTDVEATDTTEELPAEELPAEELPTEELPTEELPTAGGGLEDVAANMEGTEGELMDHLMSAFKIAKGMGNEKLETQVGNTLKFFISEYIGGEK